jgi:hypothetical protein
LCRASTCAWPGPIQLCLFAPPAHHGGTDSADVSRSTSVAGLRASTHEALQYSALHYLQPAALGTLLQHRVARIVRAGHIVR